MGRIPSYKPKRESGKEKNGAAQINTRVSFDVIEEFALGEMGMSIFEFDYLTPKQYQNKVKGYVSKLERELDERWERTRFEGWCILRTIPQKKSGKKLKSPSDLFDLPSVQKEKLKQKAESKPMSKDEVKELIKRWA